MWSLGRRWLLWRLLASMLAPASCVLALSASSAAFLEVSGVNRVNLFFFFGDHETALNNFFFDVRTLLYFICL